MKMEHLLIEGFCDAKEKLCTFPCNGALKIGVHCFECSQFSYTFCPNEIAISNGEGIVEESIGYGGDMEPIEIERIEESISVWHKICKEKINEAYELFMSQS